MAQKGHLGPRPPNEKGLPKDGCYGEGSQNPLGDKRTPPRRKTKMEAWGLGIWKLPREANDSRICPEAINNHWGHKRPRESAMAKRSIEHQRGPIGHKRYGVANWPQLGSRLDCRNTHDGGSLLVVVTVPPYLQW
ncbi:hypothetical protein O181_026805 [Austropuccinia psidii MF-1]|uniref:Uncharacterized protein n=1 Tax=Austropuccinia psidii MF-1 TaxID=1389203 RepID=A0A9Q3H2J5_9BASI|nr:hypothetical protein [Austropuccinia psidii MF-1]